MQNQKKILFIQFKFLGDVIFLTPAIKAFKAQFPYSEIHILVSSDVAPLLENLDFIDKVWPFPRVRGKINLIDSLKFLAKLRSHKFDLSLDFEGNDRGSLISRLIKCKYTIGAIRKSSSFLQKTAYSKVIDVSKFPPTYISFNKHILEEALNFRFTKVLPGMQIFPDKNLVKLNNNFITGKFIIFNVSTTQEKKQWGIDNWVNLWKLSKKYTDQLWFSAGPSHAEQYFLKQLKKRIPKANILKPMNDIKIFIALLSNATLLVSNDSGPLHFAAAMNVKTIGLFGPNDSVKRAAPIYGPDEKLIGKKCECINSLGKKHFCSAKIRCIDTIKPIEVFSLMEKQIKKAKNF